MHFSLNRSLAFCLWLASCTVATAADFGFSVIIRAGSNAASDWEIGIGARGSAPASTASLNPYYQDGTAQQFQIGYAQSTNTAYVRFYNNGSGYQQATYHPAGAVNMSATGTWTLPAASFSVANTTPAFYSSVSASGLALSPGLTVLQPLSTTTLTATEFLWGIISNSPASLTSPVVFRAFNNGGDWMLSGTISFAGLSAYGGSASGSQMQFGFEADASDVPEPSTALFVGCGLVLVGLFTVRRPLRQPQENRKRPE